MTSLSRKNCATLLSSMLIAVATPAQATSSVAVQGWSAEQRFEVYEQDFSIDVNPYYDVDNPIGNPNWLIQGSVVPLDDLTFDYSSTGIVDSPDVFLGASSSALLGPSPSVTVQYNPPAQDGTSLSYFVYSVSSSLGYSFRANIGDPLYSGPVNLSIQGKYDTNLPLAFYRQVSDAHQSDRLLDSGGASIYDYAINEIYAGAGFSVYQTDASYNLTSLGAGATHICRPNDPVCPKGPVSESFVFNADNGILYGTIFIGSFVRSVDIGGFSSLAIFDPVLNFTPEFIAAHPSATIDFSEGVQNIASGVPEPSIWATLISGFALIGGALRRRKIGNRSAAA